MRYSSVLWNWMVSFQYLKKRVATASLKGTLVRHSKASLASTINEFAGSWTNAHAEDGAGAGGLWLSMPKTAAMASPTLKAGRAPTGRRSRRRGESDRKMRKCITKRANEGLEVAGDSKEEQIKDTRTYYKY